MQYNTVYMQMYTALWRPPTTCICSIISRVVLLLHAARKTFWFPFYSTQIHIYFKFVFTYRAPYHAGTGALNRHLSGLSRRLRPFRSRTFFEISLLTVQFALQLRSRKPLAELRQCISSLRAWTHKFVPDSFSFSPPEALAVSNSVNKPLGIMSSPEFVCRLFSA